MANTARSQDGGRIITQNPELLSLLTQGSGEQFHEQNTDKMDQALEENEDQLQKIYVDSPAFDEVDDEKYKYVSTNVEDFDENQLKAFMLDPDPSEELVENPTPHSQSRLGSTSTRDQNGAQQQTYDTGVTPNRFTGLTQGDDEDEELRKEQEYQDSLLRRIADQKTQAENFEIPKLDLSDMADNPQDSLDPSLGSTGGKFHEINLRDSLEMDQMQKAKDQERLRQLMMEDGNTGDNPPLHQNIYRLNLNEVDQEETRGVEQPYKVPVVTNDPGMTNNAGNNARLRKLFPHPPVSHHYHDIPSQPPAQLGMGYPQHSNQHHDNLDSQRPPPIHPNYPISPPLPVPPYHHQQQQQQLRSPNPNYHLQQHQYPDSRPLSYPYQAPQPVHQQEHLNQNEFQFQEQIMAHQAVATGNQPGYHLHQQPPDQMYTYGQQQSHFNNQFANHNFHHQQPPSPEQPQPRVGDNFAEEESGQFSPAPSDRSNQKPPKPKIDFLARNKKDFSQAVPTAKNSYSNSYLERKKRKENIPPSPNLGKKRSPVKAKHPGAPQKETSTGTFIFDDDKPKTAETVWSRHAQSLKAVRTEKVSKASGKRYPLKKYPSESRVDDMKQTVSSAPPKLQPIEGTPRQAFTEPIRTEVEIDTTQAGKGPIRHTVFTDDGQRVSVDINLKLVSPGPYYGGVGAGGSAGSVVGGGGGGGGYVNPVHMAPPPPPLAGPISQRPVFPIAHDRQMEGYNYHPALPPPPPPHTHLQHHQPYPQDPYDGYHSQAPLYSDRTTPMSQRSNFTPGGGSPFKVLPPIHPGDNQSRGERTMSQASETGTYKVTPRFTRAMQRREEEQLPPKDDSSYLEQMRKAKQKKPLEYRRYTVDDYNKLKREVRLGGLGPDLDNEMLKDKKEKRDKQLEYAQKIKERNKKDFQREMFRPSRKPEHEDDPKDDMLHRRNIALEYAKSVPKPKVRPQRIETRQENSAVESLRGASVSPQHQKKQVHLPEEDTLDLATLRQRHEEEKQKAALIRQQIEAGQ